MIFHPAIIAMHSASFVVGSLILCSAWYAVRIRRKWDFGSGSEGQLILERQTYLISTILTYVLVFELMSFFLYTYTAECLHPLFVGAMCAAGALKANSYGYPALMLKMANCMGSGLWLIMNHADNQAYDYPLIRKKYLLLLFITPLVLVEIIVQTRYFMLLRPDIITSCCGTLFSAGSRTLAGDLASLPPVPMAVLFYLSTAAHAAAGIYFYRSARGGYLFGGLSVVHFIVSVAAILSFISPYIYELPTHHCPFCMLQREYAYIGYPLYTALFGSTVAGAGAATLAPFRNIASLAASIPSMQKKLILVSLIMSLIFAGIVVWEMVATDFVLQS